MKLAISISMLLLQLASVESFQQWSWIHQRSRLSQLRQPKYLPAASASISAATSTSAVPQKLDKKAKLAELRKEGGRFTILTPAGALNPFGLYYGVVSVLLGIPWFIAMTCLQFAYFLTRGKIDRQRRFPIWISQCWGETLMTLTRMWPKISNKEILQQFYEQNRAAMIVANHNSWMDIPFLGATIGWKNYKLVSKKELGKVPILGKSIKVGGHIMVDRTDRKSQLRTLKSGINYLKDGLILGTFPEGTRSRSGKLGKFKNGAFKMAYKASAPIIPISINGAAKIMSADWVMPHRRSKGVVEVVIHEPIESKGKTEEELAEAVRQSMISGLAPDQQPNE